MPLPPHAVLLLIAAATAATATAGSAKAAAGFSVTPEQVVLRGNFDRLQLVVGKINATGKRDDHSADLTHKARYASLAPDIVSVNTSGRLVARNNGQTRVEVVVEGETRYVTVRVSEVVKNPVIGFKEQVGPILSKHGCNMGACHASQHGKGGFKLSVFGFAPGNDRRAIIRDRHQRRVNLLRPEDSLFLRKPTTTVPHGGGHRLGRDSIDHEILVAWLLSGASGPQSKAPKVTGLKVFPNRHVGSPGTEQQLRVVAHYSDKTSRDVTAWAKYDSMDESILDVAPSGLVTASDRGQATVMVRYEGQAQIAMFVTPFAESVSLDGWKNNNFVDALAETKFRELAIAPSGLCSDDAFIRRAYLDATGTLPTPDETRDFLASTRPDKRQRLIDELLGLTGDPKRDRFNDRYAAWWTLKWSDLIRNSSNKLGEQGMWALHNWIRESFRTNKRFDRFVTELVTAKGSIYS
ncbi:MAG: DUF1549 domain-containing protein, partial [Planctomycetaceae bacterium]